MTDVEKRCGESSDGKLSSEPKDDDGRCRGALLGGAVDSEPDENVGRSFGGENSFG